MNDSASKSTAPTITARPTHEEKHLFAAVAAQRQISESTLALIAIRALLDSQSPDLPPNPSSSGHVIANPPLPSHELAAFKAGVSVLAGFGRLLARTARAQTGVMTRDLQQELKGTRALVSEVERRMQEFAQAALISWDSRVD